MSVCMYEKRGLSLKTLQQIRISKSVYVIEDNLVLSTELVM